MESEENKIVTVFQSDLDKLMKTEDELNNYKQVKHFQDRRISELESWRHKVKDFVHTHGYTKDFNTYIGLSADEVRKLMEILNERP